MTERPDTLWCDKCQSRESFNMAGSHTKGTCLGCGHEQQFTIEARVKAVMDFIFSNCPESNGLDK